MRTDNSLGTENWKLKIKAKRSLGQNFLINAGILEKVVATAELNSDDTVLEIGPGTGNLTQLLAKKARQVIAVEKDHRLIDGLREKFKNTNVDIVEKDVLKLNINELFENCKLKIENSNYKVVGNIPYYITSNLLRTIFEKWPKPKLIVLTVQKEVAQRITVVRPPYNLLALSVQFYAEPKIIGYISRGSFRPMPKVDSAIIKIAPYALDGAHPNPLNPKQKEMFFKLIKAGFSEKRKQLVGSLSKNFGILKEDVFRALEKIGVKQDARAETLSLNQWIELSKFMKK